MDTLIAAYQHRILAALTPSERNALQLERVEYRLDDVLLRVGEPVLHYDFIEHGLVSMVTTMSDDRCSEAINVGAHRIVAICSVFLDGIAISDYVVAIPGVGWRASAENFIALTRTSPRFDLMTRRMMKMSLQMAIRNNACQRLHSEMQRTCRWLIKARAAMHSDEIPLTQDRLARVIGGDRQVVGRYCRQLRDAGVIELRRGKVRIRDMAALQRLTCECTSWVAGWYESIFEGI